jgi:F-type H+-transporting ATPase subunit b
LKLYLFLLPLHPVHPADRRTLATNPPSPEQRASEIIQSMPSSPGLVTKTGSVVLGTGLLAAAISQELYVVNEESIIAAAFLIFATGVYRASSCS